MGGRPRDPDYWRRWRAAHPTYRSREVERMRQRRRRVGREDRTGEYRNRRARIDTTPLAPLFQDLARGYRLAFWEEELEADLRQEAALAILEGRDPAEAVRAYRVRERVWRRYTAWLSPSVA